VCRVKEFGAVLSGASEKILFTAGMERKIICNVIYATIEGGPDVFWYFRVFGEERRWDFDEVGMR
jgi:hypothetical protein